MTCLTKFRKIFIVQHNPVVRLSLYRAKVSKKQSQATDLLIHFIIIKLNISNHRAIISDNISADKMIFACERDRKYLAKIFSLK